MVYFKYHKCSYLTESIRGQETTSVITRSQLNGTIMNIRCLRHISGSQLTYSIFLHLFI